MTSRLEQALADLEGQEAERTYDRWRNWANEYEQKREGAAGFGRQPSAAPSRFRHGVGLGVVGGLLIWAALLGLWWWLR